MKLKNKLKFLWHEYTIEIILILHIVIVSIILLIGVL